METDPHHNAGPAPPGAHHATATDARQGERKGWVWRVLLVSTIMALIALFLVWQLSPEG